MLLLNNPRIYLAQDKAIIKVVLGYLNLRMLMTIIERICLHSQVSLHLCRDWPDSLQLVSVLNCKPYIPKIDSEQFQFKVGQVHFTKICGMSFNTDLKH